MRRFDFIATPAELHCRTIGSASTGEQWTSTRYDIDGEIKGWSSDGVHDAMLIAVIDSLTLEPWNAPYYKYVFYSEIPANRIAMANLLNSVPAGNYILAYTFIDGNFKKWEDIVHQEFQTLGSTIITGTDTLDNNIPYIFFVQKGYPASVREKKGNSPTDTIDLYVTISNNWPYGDITSTVIGPSTNWGSLHWSQHELESSDSIRLQKFL